MNRMLYTTLLVGGSILGFLCTAAVIAADGGISGEEIAPVLVPLIVITATAHLTFIYRMWSSVRGEHARMTPGKAIGLLFIPIFNVYWIFNVYGGFATDYNNYIKQRAINAPALGQGLLTSYALLMLIPIPVIFWIVQTKAISRICAAVNAVLRPEAHHDSARRGGTAIGGVVGTS